MSIDVEVNAEIDENQVKDVIVEIMEEQLDEFVKIDNPCGIGQSFQNAVTKACNGMVAEAVHQDTMDSSEIRAFVREELRNALLGMMRGWDTRGGIDD